MINLHSLQTIMKHALILTLVFLLSSQMVSSQNLLPLEWSLKFDSAPTETHPINLLLSWERQGVFSGDGRGCLSCSFDVNKESQKKSLELKVGLQCHVEKIVVNNTLVGGDIPEHFYSNRNQQTSFILPEGCLNADGKNRIRIYLSSLSYTGGISHNSCTLSPVNSTKPIQRVAIQMEPSDHLFAHQSPAITLHYKVNNKTTLRLIVNSDFHRRITERTFTVSPSDSVLSVNLGREITQPGFYECVALLEGQDNSGRVEWLAYRPEEIGCKDAQPSDFRSFWQETLAELKKIDPQFAMHKVDSLSRGKRDGYVIEMKSLGGLTIRGYYFVPRKEGRFPAILHVPYYGQGFQNVDQFINSTDDVIELALCARGHGLSADTFNPGFGVPGIWGYKLYSKQENAYRGIYMDCVRAVDVLFSRPETDTLRVGVRGGSQGGGLTIATAGLCGKRIAACAYFDPFPCDIRDFINIRTICQKELKRFLDYYHNPCSFEEALKVQELISTKNFASWITCPVFFTTALFDDDCPPHVGFAAYNAISSPKEFKIYPHDCHLDNRPYDALSEWLKKKFGL